MPSPTTASADAATDSVGAPPSGKYLTFMLATETYGLEILSVREIIGLMAITPVPRAPSFVRGVINLRGKIIPVVDLRVSFGLDPTPETDETCVIVVDRIVDGVNAQVGLLVDRVSEVLPIEEEAIEPTPTFGTAVNADFILGIAKAAEGVIILLEIDAALGQIELSTSATKEPDAVSTA